jgi:predicted dienelactone hydrolase
VVHLWYPSDDTSGTLASYLDVSLEDSATKRYYAFAPDQLPRVRAHAFASARLSSAARRYPVVLFSHGLGLLSGFYSSFIEELVSHGYVVAGVEHSWFSGAFTLPGGRAVTNLSRNADRQRDVIVQAEDLSLVVSVLESLARAAPVTRLAGRLELRRLGVFGHSRGGFAAPHACRRDRRFKACLNLDGYSMTPAVMDSGITQPFMLVEEIAPWSPPPSDSALASFNMTRAQADSQAIADSTRRERTFERMTGGAYIVVSPGAVHNSFSDLGLIAPARFPAARQDFRRTIEITRAYLLGFFDTYLRGRPSPLLTGKAPQFPEVWLIRYRPGMPKDVFPGAPTWNPNR